MGRRRIDPKEKRVPLCVSLSPSTLQELHKALDEAPRSASLSKLTESLIIAGINYSKRE